MSRCRAQGQSEGSPPDIAPLATERIRQEDSPPASSRTVKNERTLTGIGNVFWHNVKRWKSNLPWRGKGRKRLPMNSLCWLKSLEVVLVDGAYTSDHEVRGFDFQHRHLMLCENSSSVTDLPNSQWRAGAPEINAVVCEVRRTPRCIICWLCSTSH